MNELFHQRLRGDVRIMSKKSRNAKEVLPADIIANSAKRKSKDLSDLVIVSVQTPPAIKVFVVINGRVIEP